MDGATHSSTTSESPSGYASQCWLLNSRFLMGVAAGWHVVLPTLFSLRSWMIDILPLHLFGHCHPRATGPSHLLSAFPPPPSSATRTVMPIISFLHDGLSYFDSAICAMRGPCSHRTLHIRGL